jgi:hypothetical protein
MAYTLSAGGGTGNAPIISLRPGLITEHHSVCVVDLAREAAPSSTYLRQARAEDTTYTVGGNCSRVEGNKRTDNIETRGYSSDASVRRHRSNLVQSSTRALTWQFMDRPTAPGRSGRLRCVLGFAASESKTFHGERRRLNGSAPTRSRGRPYPVASDTGMTRVDVGTFLCAFHP